MSSVIRISNVPLQCYRAIVSPDFREKTVITSNPWEYVSLWLRNNRKKKAVFYWVQAKNFYDASVSLPVNSSPLPLYYSFLNAAKVLLEVKGVSYQEYHGVSKLDLRSRGNRRVSIETEGVALKRGGVASSLVFYYGENCNQTEYNLSEILANLAFIHRSYAINHNKKEIFLRINDPRYIKTGGGRAKFQATLSVKNSHPKTILTLPPSFVTREPSDEESVGLERGQRLVESSSDFTWSGGRRPTENDMNSLKNFHKEIRFDVQYVAGDSPIWYIKRSLAEYNIIKRSNIVLIIMAMHRISELARYKPIEFDKILSGKRNWVVHEFIKSSPRQFFDELVAEITGCEIFESGVNRKFF